MWEKISPKRLIRRSFTLNSRPFDLLIKAFRITITKIVKEHEEYTRLITFQNEKLKSENEIIKNKIKELTIEKKVEKETKSIKTQQIIGKW